jgi:D-3-phosphoglycerate dehydrogenase / 2-oxoglutarate reductase
LKKVICITKVDHLFDLKEKFESICNLDYRPGCSEAELVSLVSKNKYDAIFTNPNKQNFILGKDILHGTSIRLINTASTGLNHIDIKYCKNNNIEVLSLTKDYGLIRNLPSTAELGFGLYLSLMRKIPESFQSVALGKWDYEPFVGNQIAGQTAGIIGYGRLGTFMARYCNAFGMKVLVFDPYKNVFDYDQVSYDEILERSSMISLHVHVKDDTIEMINRSAIEKMKMSPIIINTSRGEIVDEIAVLDGLRDKKISGYGTDVIKDEFSCIEKSPIVRSINEENLSLLVTPHTGGMSYEGQHRAYKHAINKFRKII